MMASSCPLHWGAMSTSSYDIRSGRVAYVTLCARARMFGHAEAELRLCTDQSEHCSLGVQALDDPASTRHLMRSIQDSASPFLEDRKSTRLNPVTNAHLVCRLLLEQKKT